MRFRILRNFLLSAAFSLLAFAGFAQTITPATGSITSFSSIYGDASTPKNFSFTGAGFTPGQPAIVIANAESEVSTALGGPYASSVSINSDGSGNIASTTIYVRTAEATIPGVYLSKQIRIENAGGTLIGTRTISQITVNTRSLDIINVAIEDKVYDGNTSATVTNNGSPISLDNLRTADLGNVTISFSGATATFDDANVGSFKTVTVTGYSISGPASSYYTLIPLPAQSGNITAKPLSINAIQANKTYGTSLTSGSGFTGFNAVGAVGAENPGTVTVTYGSGSTANANVGTYNSAVVLSALTGGSGGFLPGNYTITYNSANIVVNPKALTLSGAGANNKIYNGNSVAVLNGGVSLNAGVEVGDDCTLDASGATGTFASPNVANGINVTVSGYALTGAQAGNYSLTQPTGITANITEKALTITANTINKPYGDVLTTGPGKTAFSSSGLVAGETIASVTLTYGTGAAGTDPVAATNVGGIVASAPVSGVGFIATNYAISYTAGDLTVAPKSLTITATPVNKTYGTALTSGAGYSGFNAVGLVSGEVAGTVTVTYGTGSAANANVGTYNNSVVLSALTGGSGGFNPSNYTIGYADANIVVGAKTLTLSGAGVSNKVYDGNTNATLNTATLVGVESGDDCTLDATLASGTFASANAANGIGVTITGYALAGTAAGNYTLTQPSGITANITPKALGITANTVTKTYGDVLTSGSGKTAFTSSGLVSGETIASVTLTYGIGAAGTDPVAATNVGGIVASAPVAGVGFIPANYAITYTPGDLTVSTRALAINATAVNKIYGDVLTSGAGYTGFNTVGLQNGETAGTVTVAYGTGAAATDPVGTTVGGVTLSSITGGTINASNYAITYTGTDLNVTPRTLNINANNVSKTTGAVLTGGSGSTDFVATGLQNGETAGTVTITYTGVGPTAPATAGVYSGSVVPSALTGGSITPSNYAINYIAGDITVSAGSITITATNENKPYGTALTSGAGKTTFTVTGTLQPGESITSVTLNYGAGGAAGDAVGANVGTIIPSLPAGAGGFVASNYIITYVNGNITVTTAPLTITATNETKAYGTALTSGAGKTTFTSTGLATGETIASVTLTYGTGALATAGVGSNAGTIVPSAPVAGVGFNAANYAITYANGDIIVSPTALTVTADSVRKYHGEVITTPATGVTAFTATGLQNGETIGSVTMNYGTGAAALDPLGLNIGSVVPSAATGGTFNAANYTITYAPNQLRVVPNNNAFLSNLVSNTGPLNTAFNKFDLDYDTYVLTAINSFIVTATTENQFATMQARIDTGNGPGAYIPLTSGVASSSFAIREGDNIIEILVTAEDGITQFNYRILYRRESTFVSGGGGGGLESKSLGDAIAQRVLSNAINDMNGAVDYNKLPVVETAQGTIRSTSTNSLFSLQLSSIMPDLATRGYKAYNSSPVDIVSFTNAKEVYAVDYVNTNKETKAVAFTTKTLGELYDHTKPICDRLKGATLLDVESVKIDGYNFINYTIINDKGNREYATAFTVGAKAGRNSFNLQSAFLTTSYVNEDQMYNFQIWAASPSIVNEMVKDVLAKLKDVAEVNQAVVGTTPASYIESGKREGTNLNLVIKNASAATTGFFKFEDRSTESSTGIVTRNVPFTVKANGTSTVVVPVGDKYESTVSMYLNGEVKDLVYMSDGTWAVDYNRNTTNVSAFNVTNDAKRTISANEYPVLRNVEVKANSADFVSLFKLLKAGGMEADLSNYNGIKFTAAGGYNLRVTMVKNGVAEWKNQYTTDIRLGSGQQEYYIPFSQFKSAGSTKVLDPTDVTTLVLTIEVGTGRNSPIASTFSNISFTKEKPAINTADQEEKTIQVFPNPVTDNVFTASFVSPVAGEFTMKINDGTGRSIYSKQVNVVKGPNAVPVRLNNGVIGTHFLTLEGNNVKFAPTTVVIVK
jgi:hypothetical protein